jgi:hypothetical protein
VDEKSQIQALERTQPMLPMGLAYVAGVGSIPIGRSILFKHVRRRLIFHFFH